MNCKCIAFRLDDVQDFWISASQIAVIEAFKEFKFALTIGIIGGYFGNDTNMVNYVNNQINDPEFCVEVAQHGIE